MTKILVINGPNLNLLGCREPNIYGSDTLKDLEDNCIQWGLDFSAKVECFQSNHEGDIIDKIQNSREKLNISEKIDAIVINAGAYTHTSVAIRDAIAGVNIPFYEVHISNVHAREKFRHDSYLSDLAVGVVCGFGTLGYKIAIETAVLNSNK